MLCSHPVFAGVNTRIDTIQGGVKYIDTKRDSAKSFIFNLNVLNDKANIDRLSTYQKFQLGLYLLMMMLLWLDLGKYLKLML